MDLDLKQVLRLARRWWWLLLLLPAITGATTYVLSDRQTPQYSATVMIRINPPASAALDLTAVQLAQDLTETYRRLIMTRPVLQAAIDTLGLPMKVYELAKHTSATTVSSTQLVRISVSDTDPQRAALIANTIASTFATRMENDTLGQAQSQQAGQDAGVETTPADGVVAAQTQVSISEPAVAPAKPYAPRLLLNTLLGVVAGMVLASGLVILQKYFESSITEHTDVEELSGVPVLATIRSVPLADAKAIFTLTSSHSAATEAVRMLRTNLEFAAAAKPFPILAVTSPGMGDGKSTVSANLAVVLAQAGLSTVLIDADLRRPSQHRIFDVSNGGGLTRLLTHADDDWQTIAHQLAVPNLRLITSGQTPPNPADLLRLDRFGELLITIAQDADMVIIDTPPLLAVSDSLVVAHQAGAALLVVRAGHTRKDALQHASEALGQGGIRLVGVVRNRQHVKDGSGDYYAADPVARRRPWSRRKVHSGIVPSADLIGGAAPKHMLSADG